MHKYKRLVSAQGPQAQVRSTKKMYLPQWDKGRGSRTREREGAVYPGGTRDCLWIEDRQTWLIGKWLFIRVKWEALC